MSVASKKKTLKRELNKENLVSRKNNVKMDNSEFSLSPINEDDESEVEVKNEEIEPVPEENQVATKAYVVNPQTGRSCVVGGKTYRKLIQAGVIPNHQFHLTPGKEVVKVIEQKGEETPQISIWREGLNKKAKFIADKLINKYMNELVELEGDVLMKKVQTIVSKELGEDQLGGVIDETDYEFENENFSEEEEYSDEENDENESE